MKNLSNSDEWADLDCLDELLMDFADDVSISTTDRFLKGHNDNNTSDISPLELIECEITRSGSVAKQKVVNRSKGSKTVRKFTRTHRANNSESSQLKKITTNGASCNEMKLRIYPLFEKCDSLIHFPHTMTRHLNTSDHESLARLMHSYVDKSCEVHFSGDVHRSPWNYQRLLDMFVFTADLHPDALICVHTAKVVEHEINATIYFKYTDNIVISESVARSTNDPEFLQMRLGRGEKLKKMLRLEDRPEQEREELATMADSNTDLEVYGKLELKVSIDSHTKKIVRLVFDGSFTSLASRAPTKKAPPRLD